MICSNFQQTCYPLSWFYDVLCRRPNRTKESNMPETLGIIAVQVDVKILPQRFGQACRAHAVCSILTQYPNVNHISGNESNKEAALSLIACNGIQTKRIKKVHRLIGLRCDSMTCLIYQLCWVLLASLESPQNSMVAAVNLGHSNALDIPWDHLQAPDTCSACWWPGDRGTCQGQEAHGGTKGTAHFSTREMLESTSANHHQS